MKIQKFSKFSKKEAIIFGWQTMKSNFWFFIGLLIIIEAGVFFVPSIIIFILKDSSLAFLFISLILFIIFILGLIKISLNFYDGKKSKTSDLFTQYPLFFKHFFIIILFSFLIYLPVLIYWIAFEIYYFEIAYRLYLFSYLFILPLVIYFGIKFCFFGHFIVDKKFGIIEALKKSFAITKGSTLNLFLFSVLSVIINIVGLKGIFILLFLYNAIFISEANIHDNEAYKIMVVAFILLSSFLITIPITIMAITFIYRKLSAQVKEV